MKTSFTIFDDWLITCKFSISVVFHKVNLPYFVKADGPQQGRIANAEFTAVGGNPVNDPPDRVEHVSVPSSKTIWMEQGGTRSRRMQPE